MRTYHPVTVVEEFVLKSLERTEPVFCGIDPGTSGCIAFICGPHHVVVDMPVFMVKRTYSKAIPKKKRIAGGPKTKLVHGETARYDYPMIVRVFKALRPIRKRVHVCVEIAKPMIAGKGGNNIRTAHLTGIGFGMWPLFLESKGYPRKEVEPSAWKRAMRLIGKDKDASRKKAKRLFPEAALTRKKDHGRAEALLLAVYWRRLHDDQTEVDLITKNQSNSNRSQP